MNKEYCVLFLRVSTERQQREGLSLEAQESFLKDCADRNNFIPVKIFSIGESGRPAIRRKFDEMLNWMKENEVRILLVEKQDRYSRQGKEDFIESLRRVCKDYGIQEIHFPKDGKVWDSEKEWTSQIKLTSRIQHAVDVYKSENISDEVLKANRKMLNKGIPLKLINGYKWVGKKGNKRIDKTEMWDKIKLFLQIYNDKKYSLSQMVKIAKDIGLRSVNGKTLDRKEDVSRIIESRFYAGSFEYRGAIKELHGIYPIKVDGYEPIISEKEWKQNQEILKMRSTYKKPDTKKDFLFNDLMICARCQKLFYGNNTRHWRKWKIKTGKDKGKVEKRPYDYTIYTHMRGHHFTINGKNVVASKYVDPEKMEINQDIKWIDEEGNERISQKKGTKVYNQKCTVSQIKEEDVKDVVESELGILHWNEASWKDLKGRLFKDETKDFIDFELRQLREEKSKNENKKDRLYEDYQAGVITGEFIRRKMGEIEARQKEIEVRLEELEEDRQCYDDKFGKQIEMLDRMKDFHKIWKKASYEKKVDILRLITVKILVNSKKVKKNNKTLILKDIQIVYNDEIQELFDLGLMERIKQDETPKIPVPNRFHRKTIKDG